MRERALRTGAWLAITAAIFLMVEGAASVSLFVRALQTDARPAPQMRG